MGLVSTGILIGFSYKQYKPMWQYLKPFEFKNNVIL